MATTYWDFSNDKPTGDMTLKADWKIKQVTINIYDSTNFLEDRYRSAGQYYINVGGVFVPCLNGSVLGSVYNYEFIGYSRDIASATRTYSNDSSGIQWYQSNVIASTFDMADYGVAVDDYVSIGTSTNISIYGKLVPYNSSDINKEAFIQLRGTGVKNQPRMTTYSTGWRENWGKVDSTWFGSKYWEAFITRRFPNGTYKFDDTSGAWQIHFNRKRDIKVDYGATVGQFLSRSDLPTGWKKAVGSVKPPSEWIVNTSGSLYIGKKLGEIPTNTTMTRTQDFRVTY